MTIASSNNQEAYTGNDATSIFPYGFKINDDDHLEIVIADAAGAETTLTKTTHYTVSGVGEEAGGNVTTEDLTALVGQANLPSGYDMVITRRVPLKQETDLENQGAYYAQTVEDLSDYLTMIAQQQQEELDRCPKVDISSGLTGNDLLDQINASEAAAAASASAASTSETNAATSETNAATSETNAGTSETNAGTSETNAAASASAASTSETNAGTSETNAAASAAAASTSETNAGTSETNAAASASAASTSETNAGTSETNAAASASAAATSETNAGTSETNAASSASDAADSLAAAGLPADLTGESGNVLKVNPAEDGYVFETPQDLPSVGAGDAGKVAVVNDAETGYELGTVAGGGGGSDLDDALFAAETGIVRYNKATTLIDTYKGYSEATLTNMEESSDAARLSPSQTSGSIERKKPTSGVMNQVETRVVYNGQFFKADNAAVTGNAFVLSASGDYTDYFPTGKNVVILKELSSEGETVLQHLLDDDDYPAHLAVASTSFSSGTNKTTVNITNPQTLDLDMGLTADWEDYLRIVPVDVVVKASSDDSATYETLPLTHAANYNGGEIGIPGEGYFNESNLTLTGTCHYSDTKYSPNETYGYKRTLENRSGNHYFVHEFSTDTGKTWNYFGGSKANSETDFGATGPGNENGGNFERINNSQIILSDNGRFHECHPYYDGSYYEVHGRRGDLSDGADTAKGISHADHLTPDTGETGGAGVIFNSTSANYYGQVAADHTDGSFVVFGGKRSDNTARVRSFSNYGGTYLGNASIAGGIHDHVPLALEVSGTGTSHKVHIVGTNDSNEDFYAYYVTEAAPTTMNSQGNIDAGTNRVIDSIITSTKFIVFFEDNQTELNYMYKTLSSDVWSGPFELAEYDGVDIKQGWSAATATNFHKSHHQKIWVDSSDEDHVIFVQECSDLGVSIIAPIAYEVVDIGNFEGVTISQATNNAVQTLRNSASDEEYSQTFTAPASGKIETAVFKLYQIGAIASGSSITAELWPTSGGLPDYSGGSKIADADQSFDPSTFTVSTTAQHIRFNFPRSVSLTPSTVYAVVVKGDYTIDGTNYVRFRESSSSSYAGGQRCVYNGATWANSTTNDAVFYIASHRITNLGDATHSDGSHVNSHIHNFEASIKEIDSSNLRFVMRRVYRTGTDTHIPIGGHPYQKIIGVTAGGGVEMDTETNALQRIGFNAVEDENLVFNVSLGNPDNYAIDTITGANTGEPYFHRVGIPINNNNQDSTGIWTTDTDFISTSNPTGGCGNFGVGNYVGYGQADLNSGLWDFADYAFIIEAEIKWNGAGNSIILSQVPSTNVGWHFGIQNNYLHFGVNNWTSTMTVASDKVEPQTYHKVRVTKDSSGVVKLWRAENPADDYTIFTEVANYSSNSADSVHIQNSTTSLILVSGRYMDTSYRNFGKIGYCKIALGTDTFAVDGYQDQSAIVSIQNHGHRVSGEKITGETDNAIGNNFDKYVDTTCQESAKVDSYTQTLTHKQSALTNTGSNLNKKIEVGRGTTDHTNSIEGDIEVFDQ